MSEAERKITPDNIIPYEICFSARVAQAKIFP